VQPVHEIGAQKREQDVPLPNSTDPIFRNTPNSGHSPTAIAPPAVATPTDCAAWPSGVHGGGAE
jgi:hypothetical protein